MVLPIGKCSLEGSSSCEVRSTELHCVVRTVDERRNGQIIRVFVGRPEYERKREDDADVDELPLPDERRDVDDAEDPTGEDDRSPRWERFPQSALNESSEQELFSRADQQERQWDQQEEHQGILLPEFENLILCRFDPQSGDQYRNYDEERQEGQRAHDDDAEITEGRHSDADEVQTDPPNTKVDERDTAERHALQQDRTQEDRAGRAGEDRDTERLKDEGGSENDDVSDDEGADS